MRLLQFIVGIRDQEFLLGFGEIFDCNIFHSHQLRVKVVILVSAVLSFKILNVQSVGSGNAYMKSRGVRCISGLE